ncbi:MAG: hypothetical protein PHG83_03520 [Patescibacteria group bacterium]|nr:hypothetical protein [Patescibacteria group bacterium]
MGKNTKKRGEKMDKKDVEFFKENLYEELKVARNAKGQLFELGQEFRFGFRYGAHYTVLIGTITGIRVSDEGGLQLQISNRRKGDARIDCIIKTEKGWDLITLENEISDSKIREYYPGIFF